MLTNKIVTYPDSAKYKIVTYPETANIGFSQTAMGFPKTKTAKIGFSQTAMGFPNDKGFSQMGFS